MNTETIVEQLFPLLVSGDRAGARTFVQDLLDSGLEPESLACDGYWPALSMINTMYRSDQLSNLAHHYAARLLRSLVDQAQACYEQKPRQSKRILLFCGPTEADDLAGQMVADLAEAGGYEVWFGGGGIANDEILEEIGEKRPDILLMFSSAPTDAPHIRVLIDTIRSVDSCPDLQIAVGGGVFARAEGLAEEIGADLWADEPRELLDRLEHESDRRATPEQRTVGRTRREAA